MTIRLSALLEIQTLFCVGLLAASSASADAAADVTFDDSDTALIEGANVQEALESADGAIAELHGGIEDDADVVYVRADCTGIRNCFTSMAALAGSPTPPAGGGNPGQPPTHPSSETNASWLWATRQPTPSSPVLVDVGPGTWGPFLCPDHTSGADFGGVTLRGSGRDTTVLQGFTAGIDVQNCFGLQIMDLTAIAEIYGVRWANGGSANWHDVDAIAERTSGLTSIGWVDNCSTVPETPSFHYLFNSRVIARGSATNSFAYVAGCSETWFYGGEIRVEGNGKPQALVVDGGSDFRAFGSAIRVLAAETIWAAAIGVAVQDAGTAFHLHGGIVSVFASSASGSGHTVDATGLTVSTGAFAHTPGAAWVVQAPDGTSTRVKTTATGPMQPLGVAQAPFLWQSSSDEPEPGLISQTGSDLFVETDCNASTGVCDGSGTPRPHLMVYDATCSPTPWFDIVTNACRVD